MTGTVPKSIEFRPYEGADELAVLALQRIALGGGPTGNRTEQFFRWKHLHGPFGRSFLFVAKDGERIVGLRSFMRWEFFSGDKVLSAVRAVDTATHPEYQRRGIFAQLNRTALEVLRDEVDFVFNTPNQKTLPGDLKMGWKVVGKLPVAIRVCNPVHVALSLRHLRSSNVSEGRRPGIHAPSADEALQNREAVVSLLKEAEVPDYGIATRRDLAYVQWRYAQAPQLDYRCVSEEDEGMLTGLAFFRVRPRRGLWESTVGDVFVRAGDRRTARRLLANVRRAAAVDHLTCMSPARSTSAAASRASGFIRMPRGVLFLVNPLLGRTRPDPTDLRSWALSLGDVEVF